MRIIPFLLFVVASDVAIAHAPQRSCSKFSSTYIVSAPLKIVEIEKVETERIAAFSAIRDDIPKLPFGFENSKWVEFKAKIKPGDKIVSYSSDRKSWSDLAGQAGYAILRSGCIVEDFVTMQN